MIRPLLTSVTQKNVPSAVVIQYCAWYVFLRNRRYIINIIIGLMPAKLGL